MERQKSFFVTDYLDKRSKHTPDKIALQNFIDGKEYTFKTWNYLANQTANYLHSFGIEKGDIVSIYSTNCFEFLNIIFACGKIGAILHNLNWRLTVNELSEIMKDVNPKVFIYSEEWKEQTNQLRKNFPDSCKVVAISEKAEPDDLEFNEYKNFSAELEYRPELVMDDPWGIYYTGGTTGLPKGSIMTHGNILWNNVNTIATWGICETDIAPLQLPLFHIGGPNIFMFPLVHVGGKTILCKEFDLEQTFDLIEKGGITHYVAVPTMYIMIQRHPRWEKTDFTKLRLVISGGASCPLPVMEKFWNNGVDFKMGYGLTEAGGNNFWLPPIKVREKPRSVGFPAFHVNMKIVKEDGTVCEPNEEGELLIKGPHITPGYWNKSGETANIIKDGWLHTGDIARQDEDGCFYIIGRSKDMFISGGENVYPAEIESIIHSHPLVEEAALIGVPHEKWGEVGKAFIVLKANQTLTEKELIDFLMERLAKYKVPRSVVFIDKMP
ncbi:MAG: long-chain fatty acid--CoA ligase, partial [Ignavibacteria bacterium]